MKTRTILLIAALAATLLPLCSCDEGNSKFCDRTAMIELMKVNYDCSDASYRSDNGYVDYNECFDNDSRAVVLSIMSCKGRDGIAP